MNKLISTLIILFLTTGLNGQKLRYLSFQAGGTFYGIMDEAFSPVRYYGPGMLFNLGYRKFSPSKITRVNTTFSTGLISPSTQFLNHFANANRLDFSFNCMAKKYTPEESPLSLSAGGGFRSSTWIFFNSHLNNSSVIYASFNSLYISAAAILEFPFGHRMFRFSYTASLEPASWVFRPNYIRVLDFLDPRLNEAREIFKLSGPYFLGKFIGYSWESSLMYVISNKNAFELSYHWDFYHLSPSSYSLSYAMHSLRFGFLFNF